MAFEQWCVIDLFGHSRIAGKVTEQEIGGSFFIRVDVPKTKNREAFSKFFGPNAIYSISPCDEPTAIIAAESYDVAPVDVWRLQIPTAAKMALAGGAPDDDGDDANDDGDDDD